MCDDPRTHDAHRTAAALADSYVAGDTTGVDLLLHREGDAAYPAEVAIIVAHMAYATAETFGDQHILPWLEMIAHSGLQHLPPSEQFAHDAADAAKACAEYIGLVLNRVAGRDAARAMTRRFINKLACEH
ncbi:MAG: hypothetical protein ACOC9R_01745 [bacterium]